MHQDEHGFDGTWIKCVVAYARKKKLKDNKEYGGENEITYLLLIPAGCETIMIISLIIYPRESKNFDSIKSRRLFLRFLDPK